MRKNAMTSLLDFLKSTALSEVFWPQKERLPSNVWIRILWSFRLFAANILIVYVAFLIYIYLFSLLYYFLTNFSFGPDFALYSVRWVMFDQFFVSKPYLGGELFFPYQLAYFIYTVSVFIRCWRPDVFDCHCLSPALLAIGLSTAFTLLAVLLVFTKAAPSFVLSLGLVTLCLTPLYFWLTGYNIFAIFGKYLMANKNRIYYKQNEKYILSFNAVGFVYITFLYVNLFTEIYFKNQRQIFF